jgi:F420H(2)-dependent quinone reductase
MKYGYVQLTRAERFDSWLSRRLPRLGPRLHRRAYRLSGGRVGGTKRGIPVALLTTTGRHSGAARTTPVMVLPDGDRWLSVASNAGLAAPPAWLLNLQARPEARLEVRGECRLVRAKLLTGSEREHYWPRLVRHNPLFADFQSRTSREATVVAFETQE